MPESSVELQYSQNKSQFLFLFSWHCSALLSADWNFWIVYLVFTLNFLDHFLPVLIFDFSMTKWLCNANVFDCFSPFNEVSGADWCTKWCFQWHSYISSSMLFRALTTVVSLYVCGEVSRSWVGFVPIPETIAWLAENPHQHQSLDAVWLNICAGRW